MEDIRSRNFFCRITEKNELQDGSIYKYNFKNVYNQLCDRYKNVLYIVHDKDNDNIHAHFLIQDDNAIRKSTLIQIMPYGSIQKQRGSNNEVYRYFQHLDDDDKEKYDEKEIKHNIHDIQKWLLIENGQGSRNDFNAFRDLIKDGASNNELNEYNPMLYARYSNYVDRMRQDMIYQDAQKTRNLFTHYFYGSTGTGKSYTARHNHDSSDIYVVMDYKHPWDNYNGQKVVIFEEYRGNFPITDMLNYLDEYPLQLGARYQNKWALYTEVYIISNIPLTEQYNAVDEGSKKAFDRRIKDIKLFTDQEIITYNKKGQVLEKIPNPLNQEIDLNEILV